MKFLLDTHIYLWAINEAERLSPMARAAIGDPSNELYLSVASLWEATIKIGSGKLRIPGQDIEFLLQRLVSSGVQILPVLPSHLRQLQTLPLIHRDPFDRMLVAQARVEGLTLVTADAAIREYAVACL